MTSIDISKSDHTKLIEQNKMFRLYLFSATLEKDLEFVFNSNDLAIFVCLNGKLISNTKTLSYQLSEKFISFALKHCCKKIVPKDQLTEFLILSFSQKILEKLIVKANEDVALTMNHFTSCQCTVHNCNNEILSLSHKLLKESTENYWGRQMVLTHTFQALLISFVRLFTNDKAKNANETIDNVKQILAANLLENLNLKRLSDECGVSKSHLCRIFKSSTGQTISQYFNLLKIETACSLLAVSGLSIEEIAIQSGFNNPSYFFRVFKKQTGKLPLEWKKSHSIASK